MQELTMRQLYEVMADEGIQRQIEPIAHHINPFQTPLFSPNDQVDDFMVGDEASPASMNSTCSLSVDSRTSWKQVTGTLAAK